MGMGQYLEIHFSGMNTHLPAILGFTRYQGFDPSPCEKMVIFHLQLFLLAPRLLQIFRHLGSLFGLATWMCTPQIVSGSVNMGTGYI